MECNYFCKSHAFHMQSLCTRVHREALPEKKAACSCIIAVSGDDYSDRVLLLPSQQVEYARQ